MAKPNNNNQKQNNWFTKQQQKYGNEFMRHLDARTIQNSALQIFRDLARRKIDLRMYGHIFQDTNFLECLIIEANKHMQFHGFNFIASNWYTAQNFDTNGIDPRYQLVVLEENKKRAKAFELIVHNLNAIKQTSDVNYIYALVDALNNFRNNI